MPDSVIASRQQRDGELRVALSQYRGRTFLSARAWYRDAESGELLPGKGLSIPATLIPWLRRALERAEAAALTDALLDEEAYESAGLALPAQLGGG